MEYAIGNFRRSASDAISRPFFGLLSVMPTDDAMPWALTIRMIVPGWPQMYLGHKTRGWVLFWSYALLLLIGLLFFGTTVGSFLLGLAFSIHVFSVIDVIVGTFGQVSRLERIGRLMLTTLGLFILIYLPIGSVVTAVANPQEILADMPPLHEGDVILINSWSKPAPGQLVLYEIPRFYGQIGNVGHEGVYLELAGPRIDRILAGPLDQVEWSQGTLTVNGHFKPWKPLQPAQAPAQFKLTVPQGAFLIFPTTAVPPRHAGDVPWDQISIVPAESIQGRVMARTHPLSRFTTSF
jgi:hypothetical protein